jgi:lysophospholipase L1-like esterase
MLNVSILVTCASLIGLEPASDSPGFELRDGDRVVFVGNTLIERDQVFGYLETMLTARWPDRNITFRNLGWSGDTVWGESRARFGTAADGFQHLREHVESIKPNVIFVSYGSNESYYGEAGLDRFEQGFVTLLEMVQAVSASEHRIILILPLWQENLGTPFPDPSAYNQNLKRYRDVISRLGDTRSHRVIAINGALPASKPGAVLTDNGIHLTQYGYWQLAWNAMQQLGLQAKSCSLDVGKEGKPFKTDGIRLTSWQRLPDEFRFEAIAHHLPRPLMPGQSGEEGVRERQSDGSVGDWIEIIGMRPAEYSVRVDGQLAGRINASAPARIAYDAHHTEQLRQAIVEKNRLYFHRWRPQNETYLFGFRKHEQGQNAAEVPRFDPLVEKQEKLIATLRVPTPHTYQLILESK